MKYLKPVILFIALATVGAFLFRASLPDNSPEGLIRQAEAGSEEALGRIEVLGAAGMLAQHVDLLGEAAARVSRSRSGGVLPDGFMSRWHLLFLSTDLHQNASEQVRTEYARSLLRLEPMVPDEVIAGMEYQVGRRVVGLLRPDETYVLSGYALAESFVSITANGKELWPSVNKSLSTTSLGTLGEGNTSGYNIGIVLLSDGDRTAAPGDELTVRMLLEMSVIDTSTDPPTVFAEWTEELVATPKVKTIFASTPVRPRPGDASIETVRGLLTRAETGDEGAAEELVKLGERGELRSHADELGALLAEALHRDWRPRVRSYFDTHGWRPEHPGAHPLPKPDDQTALLIGLFYLADPLSTATEETWLDVARAGVYAHHWMNPVGGGQHNARLQIKTLTPLVQTPSLSKVSGVEISLEGVEFDGESWPLRMRSSQLLTSTSPEPADHWRSRIVATVWEQTTAHGFTDEMTARLSGIEGPILDDLQTHLKLRLMHSADIALATWPVTVHTPVPLAHPAALDETTPDRR